MQEAHKAIFEGNPTFVIEDLTEKVQQVKIILTIGLISNTNFEEKVSSPSLWWQCHQCAGRNGFALNGLKAKSAMRYELHTSLRIHPSKSCLKVATMRLRYSLVILMRIKVPINHY